MQLRSPLSGRPLHAHGPHALAAGGERWPVIDGIAFLRTGRAALVAACLAALDAGDPLGATALLLRDRDDWAPGEPPSLAECRDVAGRVAELTFRDAMAALRFGPVADYLAHRWSDPTFLSGLALAEAHWRPAARVLELGCGTGAFLRAFAPHAGLGADAVTGADVVFSKLWLARHFVAPLATLLCFDAASPWPLPAGCVDLVFCHDAFYFLPDQAQVARRMRDVAGPHGGILVGHAHNADAENLSAGRPLTPAGYAALFDDVALFDDRELTAAWLDRRAPRAATAAALASAPAIALAARGGPIQPVTGRLDQPAPAAWLRRNPLYQGDAPAHRRFPSARYAAEYGDLASYPETVDAPRTVRAAEADEMLVRTRVLLDLPPRW